MCIVPQESISENQEGLHTTRAEWVAILITPAWPEKRGAKE